MDGLSTRLFGTSFARFEQLKGDASALRQQAMSAGTLGSLEVNIELIKALVSFANAIGDAVTYVIKSPAVSWIFGGELAKLASNVGGEVGRFFSSILSAGQQVLAPPPPSSAGKAQPTSPGVTPARKARASPAPVARAKPSDPGVRPVRPPPAPKPLLPKPKAKGVGGPAVAGAGVGLLVAGPPGGLIGAGAGLIYGLARKK